MTAHPPLMTAAGALLMLTLTATAGPPPSGQHRPQRPEHAAMRTPGPDQGAIAPDFTLKLLNSDETVRLSDRLGKRPVVLVFGSYT
jgi:hypothetical protein